MKGTKHFTETIKAYLDERAKTDELFAERRKAANRSIDDIVQYILNTVKASGCNGLTDEEVYGMAVHAAEEPTLDIFLRGGDISVAPTKGEKSLITYNS